MRRKAAGSSSAVGSQLVAQTSMPTFNWDESTFLSILYLNDEGARNTLE